MHVNFNVNSPILIGLLSRYTPFLFIFICFYEFFKLGCGIKGSFQLVYSQFMRIMSYLIPSIYKDPPWPLPTPPNMYCVPLL